MGTPIEPELKFIDRTWLDSAACKGASPDLFYPVGSTSVVDLEQIEQAKAVCRTCVAQIACLEYALATRQDDGIWGGKTEDERKILRKSRVLPRRSAS